MPTSRVPVTISMSPELLRRLDNYCAAAGITRSFIVQQCVQAFIASLEKLLEKDQQPRMEFLRK